MAGNGRVDGRGRDDRRRETVRQPLAQPRDRGAGPERAERGVERHGGVALPLQELHLLAEALARVVLVDARGEPDEIEERRVEGIIGLWIFLAAANLDEGAMWPTSFALKELTAAEEARIVALVKKAVS